MDRALADRATALLGRGGDQLLALGGLDDLFRSLNRDADRFFDQHIDPAIEQLTAQYMVQTVRAANIGPVEIVLAIEQLRDILIGIDLLPRKPPMRSAKPFARSNASSTAATIRKRVSPLFKSS